MKQIEVNVILTFCVHTDKGNQGIYDVTLNYEKEDKSALKLLNKNGFFHTIVQICHETGRHPAELVKISTAANWERHGIEFDLEEGKWSFASWRGFNIEWSDKLVKIYGFGLDDA
jgi:hypothetical protein